MKDTKKKQKSDAFTNSILFLQIYLLNPSHYSLNLLVGELCVKLKSASEILCP